MDLPTMDLAVRTTASTTAIWVIVIVMSIMTAILVSAAPVADRVQVRADRRARRLAALGFSGVADDAAAASAERASVGGGAGHGPVPAQRSDEEAAEAPTRPDLPAVPEQRGERRGEQEAGGSGARRGQAHQAG
jgi:hypothetical protein